METNNFQPPSQFRNKAMIKWVNGVPEPYYGDINPSSVKKLAVVAASLPYEGTWDPDLEMNIIEPRFEGLTNAEVMWIRLAESAANGDLTATNMMLDRILGKPKQSVESTSMTMSYQEFLNMIAKQENGGND